MIFYINKLENCKDNIKEYFLKIDSFLSRPLVSKFCFGLITLVSFILIYILNILHPLFGDDWMYSMLPDASTRISSFRDILYTQYEHYFTWGGRSVVHIIAQTLLLSGTQIANLLNSLAYVALTLTIYFIANQSNKTRPSLLLAINFLIWFFQPAFGSTILWITGSANYLWGTLIILLFLIPYIRFAYNPKHKSNVFKTIVMVPFGIIAGWTNENMAVALVFMLIIFIIYYKHKTTEQHKAPLWAIMGLLGAIVGAALMISAPGNYARMGMVLANAHNSQSTISIYAGRFIAAVSSYYYYALSATFIYVLLILLYRKFRRSDDNRALFISSIFFSAAIIATLAMSASPIFPGRASFGINILIFIAIGFLFSNLDFSKSLIKGLTYTTLIFGSLLFVAEYGRAYRTLKEVSIHYQARLEQIEDGKAKGQVDFILDDRISPENPMLHYYELTPDTNNWHNRMYSGYYQIHSIIVK